MIALFLFFGLLWIISFTIAKTNLITMIAASTFYFDSNKKQRGSAEVMTGVKMAYFNHFGSLAIGSALIGICQIIQFIFKYIAKIAV